LLVIALPTPSAHACAGLDGARVASPSGALVATVSCDRAGHLAWSATWRGRALASGQLGVLLHVHEDLGAEPTVLGFDVDRGGGATFPVRGAHALADVRWNELRVHLASGAASWRVDVRASDEGLALRYALLDGEPVGVLGESTSWVLPSGGAIEGVEHAAIASGTVWASPRQAGDAYEREYATFPAERMPAGDWAPPVLVRNPGGPWLALTEADNLGWSGAHLRSGPAGSRRLTIAFLETAAYPFSVHKPATTPWRVMLVADDLGGLVNRDLVAALNPPPSPQLDFGFVTPGRSVYSFWFLGAFTEESQPAAERMVRDAAALGLEWVTLDGGWWDLPDLEGLCRLAHDLGVRLMAWVDRDVGDDMLDMLRGEPHGVTGIKVDFFERDDWGRLVGEDRANLRLQADLARRAAARGMVVLFHGAAKSAGAERTWPNIVGWEGVRGLENNLWIHPLSPAHYTIVPFARALAGPYDFTPVGLHADRRAGTTVAQQLATAVILSSPTTQLAEDPGVLRASRAADLLAEVPSVWDETRVLAPSAPGDLAAFARRRGDTWWLGIASGRAAPRRVELALDFLARSAIATVIADRGPRDPIEDVDAAGIAGDDSRRYTLTVAPGARLTLDLAPGGGALVRLTPTRDEAASSIEGSRESATR